MENSVRKFLLFLLLTSSATMFSQTDFKPSGKVIVRSFFDVSQGFFGDNKQSGFDISRAFLGYQYQFSENWSGVVIVDAASGNAGGKLEPHLRNAFMNWKTAKFDVSCGMTGLLQFKTQEDFWRYRYIYKSLQDQAKMGNSVDLGITARYKFNKIFAADLTAANGEGYKKVVKNASTLFGAGVSLTPIKPLIFRAYYSIYTDGGDCRENLPENVTEAKFAAQENLSLFAGYQCDAFSFGAEYALMRNKGFIVGKEMYGISAFTNVKLTQKWQVFARYDFVKSHFPSNFPAQTNAADGQIIISGVEFQPVKQIKIAPNMRWNTEKSLFAFVNFELNF